MEIPVEILTGKIDPDWASEIATNAVDVWQFNGYSTETILGEVPIDRLGGLVVWFHTEIQLPNDMVTMREATSTVNLALGSELGLVTDTKLLLNASRFLRGANDPLSVALEQRSRPNSKLGHGGNEKWLFPVTALTLGMTNTNEFLQ